MVFNMNANFKDNPCGRFQVYSGDKFVSTNRGQSDSNTSTPLTLC